MPVTGERVAVVISCLFEDLSRLAITHCLTFLGHRLKSACVQLTSAAAQALWAAWQESHSQPSVLGLESYPQPGQALEAEHSRKGSLHLPPGR